jgi:hypothetical protein
MNKRDKMRLKLGVMRSYHTPGCSAYIKRAKSGIFISPSNSIEHEVMKTIIAYALKKRGEEFITEAVENKTNLRRDLVSINSGQIYEIETTPERAERFKGTEAVVIPTWDFDWTWLKKILEKIEMVLGIE